MTPASRLPLPDRRIGGCASGSQNPISTAIAAGPPQCRKSMSCAVGARGHGASPRARTDGSRHRRSRPGRVGMDEWLPYGDTHTEDRACASRPPPARVFPAGLRTEPAARRRPRRDRDRPSVTHECNRKSLAEARLSKPRASHPPHGLSPLSRPSSSPLTLPPRLRHRYADLTRVDHVSPTHPVA